MGCHAGCYKTKGYHLHWKQRAQKLLVVGNCANMEDFFVDVTQSTRHEVSPLPHPHPQLHIFCHLCHSRFFFLSNHQFPLLSFIAPISLLKINKRFGVTTKPKMPLEKLQMIVSTRVETKHGALWWCWWTMSQESLCFPLGNVKKPNLERWVVRASPSMFI